MARVELPGHVETALKTIALKRNFEAPTFEFSEGSDKGFIGLIRRCRIRENDRTLSVICKFLPSDEELNRKYNSHKLFKREIFVYQQVLPEFENIQYEHGLTYRDADGFWSYPECYHSEDNLKHPEKSFILMEDLAEQGFTTADMFQPSDFSHALQLFIELGKYHAISFALKAIKPAVFDRFRNLDDIMVQVMTTANMRDLAPRNCRLAAGLFERPEELHIRNKILSYEHDLWQQMEEILDGSKAEPYAALCHGDCWINNVMYSYADHKQTQIQNIRLIDWQMTFIGSVASELMYYLFCCCNKQLRDQHLEELFEIYYSSLGTMLQKFKLDVNAVFPFTMLKDQLRKFGIFSFAMATFTTPLFTKYPESLFADKSSNLSRVEKDALQLYNTTMRDVVLDLIKMEVL